MQLVLIYGSLDGNIVLGLSLKHKFIVFLPTTGVNQQSFLHHPNRDEIVVLIAPILSILDKILLLFNYATPSSLPPTSDEPHSPSSPGVPEAGTRNLTTPVGST